MKTINIMLLCAAGMATLFSCAEKQPVQVAEAAPVEKPPVTLAYVPSYSSSFEIGDPEHAKTIIQGSWKDWEDNKLDNMRDWVSDSIVAYHSDNRTLRGREAMMSDWKNGRAKYSEVKVTVDAVMPVYSVDKKENWVLVWATEVDKDVKTGKVDTSYLMETWRINKEGKADMLMQFDRQTRKQ